MAQGGKETSVANLFADLHRFGKNGEFERALKTSNKILQQLPQDEKAFHCKIVCFIQLNKFDDALTFIHKNAKLASDLAFEKAYCEYRLNRTQDAMKTIQAVEEPDVRCQELMGQILYRLENYGECFDIYRGLLKNSQDDFEEERETNLSAVMAALQMWTPRDIEEEDYNLREDTYELCYNAACYQLGKGQYQTAINKLKSAEGLCRQMFEDDPDTTEEEIDIELGVIRVQTGFALQMLKKSDEAMKLYNQVTKQKPSDIGLAAVASNNIVTLNKDQNVFDSKKKIKAATADGLHQKLTTIQRRDIAMNQSLLYMYSNQGEECRKMAESLQTKFPESDTPTLIAAAQYCKDKQTAKAVNSLQKQITKNAGNSTQLKLTLAQLHLSQGHVYKACDVLRTLGDYSYKPGVVSSLVTLYVSQEDRNAASEVLMGAVDWYKENDPESADLMTLMRANADFQLRHGSPQMATQMLEQLRKENPNDMKTLAQLILAYSRFDPEKAQITSRSLPSSSALGANIDVDGLESSVSSFVPRYSKKVATKAEASPKPLSPTGDASDTFLEKKKKKKKKSKLPKNIEPGSSADPERWLPVRERTYYRGKRTKKRKDIGKGTQGAASMSTMADLDASKPSTSADVVGSPKAGSSTQTPGGTAKTGANQGGGGTPTPTPSGQGPRQQKPQGGKSKKKKKGSKW